MGTTAHYNTSVPELKASIIKSLAFRTSRIDSSILAVTSKWALQCICNLETGIFEVIPVWLNTYRYSGITCDKSWMLQFTFINTIAQRDSLPLPNFTCLILVAISTNGFLSGYNGEKLINDIWCG